MITFKTGRLEFSSMTRYRSILIVAILRFTWNFERKLTGVKIDIA